MANERSVPTLSREDYESIESAVMETARGRWFLSEYARRNRQADTAVLLDALGRIERTVRQPLVSGTSFQLQRDVSDLFDSLQRMKDDLAQSLAQASDDARPPPRNRVFDEVVVSAERADSEALNAAEHVQEIAWSLREGVEGREVCTDLDRHAIEIYRASNQHALTTQRVKAIFSVLRDMETRIQGMLGDEDANGSVVDDKRTPWRDPGASLRNDLVLSTSASFIRDDVTFAEVDRRSERRGTGAGPVDDVYEPSPDLPTFAPAEPAGLQPAPAFADIDALPDDRRQAIFV
jgi:curved DNA-binding protein CbpA